MHHRSPRLSGIPATRSGLLNVRCDAGKRLWLGLEQSRRSHRSQSGSSPFSSWTAPRGDSILAYSSLITPLTLADTTLRGKHAPVGLLPSCLTSTILVRTRTARHRPRAACFASIVLGLSAAAHPCLPDLHPSIPALRCSPASQLDSVRQFAATTGDTRDSCWAVATINYNSLTAPSISLRNAEVSPPILRR